MRLNFSHLFLAVAAAVTPALAEHTATIPFSFTVAGQACPAGVYEVISRSQLGIVTFRNMKAAKRSYNWVLQPGDAGPGDTKIVLTFDKTGGDHALRTIQYGPMVTPRIDKGLKETLQTSRTLVPGE